MSSGTHAQNSNSQMSFSRKGWNNWGNSLWFVEIVELETFRPRAANNKDRLNDIWRFESSHPGQAVTTAGNVSIARSISAASRISAGINCTPNPWRRAGFSAYHCMLDLNARAQDASINRLRHQRSERRLIAIVHRQKAWWLKLAELRDAMVF
jgi:hypothetical protein